MAKRRKQGKRPDNAPLNFVHVHGVAFNKGGQHRDRRLEAKQGKRKHKAAWRNDPSGFSFPPPQFFSFL